MTEGGHYSWVEGLGFQGLGFEVQSLELAEFEVEGLRFKV